MHLLPDKVVPNLSATSTSPSLTISASLLLTPDGDAVLPNECIAIHTSSAVMAWPSDMRACLTRDLVVAFAVTWSVIVRIHPLLDRPISESWSSGMGSVLS